MLSLSLGPKALIPSAFLSSATGALWGDSLRSSRLLCAVGTESFAALLQSPKVQGPQMLLTQKVLRFSCHHHRLLLTCMTLQAASGLGPDQVTGTETVLRTFPVPACANCMA